MKSVLFLTIFSLLAIKILAQGRLELETPRIILDRLMVDDQPQHATFTIKKQRRPTDHHHPGHSHVKSNQSRLDE